MRAVQWSVAILIIVYTLVVTLGLRIVERATRSFRKAGS